MYPIATICLAFARGQIDRRSALRALRAWSTGGLDASMWLDSATRRPTGGYGESAQGMRP